MFKTVKSRVLAFDIEWVPDPESGKAAYGLDEDMSDREVIEFMWQKGGATEEEPMPFIKTVLSKIVSISMVFRESGGAVSKRLELHSFPSVPTSEEDCSERRIIEDFFKILDNYHPQLVGYNSSGSDIPILAQRMIKHGLSGGVFTQRPDKPWEGADYFARGSDWNVDLMRCISAWGKGTTPSLHEISVISGIPGKMGGVDGKQVAPMWLEGKLDDIIAYNECDALTTYLLWLRMAHSIGHFDSDEYTEEQRLLREMIEKKSENPHRRRHLTDYLSEWGSLSGAGQDE